MGSTRDTHQYTHTKGLADEYANIYTLFRMRSNGGRRCHVTARTPVEANVEKKKKKKKSNRASCLFWSFGLFGVAVTTSDGMEWHHLATGCRSHPGFKGTSANRPSCIETRANPIHITTQRHRNLTRSLHNPILQGCQSWHKKPQTKTNPKNKN